MVLDQEVLHSDHIIVINWLINNHIIKDKNQINMNEK
jgi:hypothetical protein